MNLERRRNNFKEAIFYLKEELPQIKRLETAILHGSARNLIEEDVVETEFCINSDIDLLVLAKNGPKLCEVHERVSKLYKEVCEKFELYDSYSADKIAKFGPIELLINFFTGVIASDCLDNIDENKYKLGQFTMEELVNNEIKKLIRDEGPLGRFYFHVSNLRAEEFVQIQNDFYRSLIEQVHNCNCERNCT